MMAPAPDMPRHVFPSADLMRIGVYHHREPWPSAEWPRDLANIRRLGFEFIHPAEFARAFLEPADGAFDITGLNQVLELAEERGSLDAQIIRNAYGRAGIAIEIFPASFVVDWREGLWVATNFSAAAQAAPLSANADLLIGESIVPVAGVTIWRET